MSKRIKIRLGIVAVVGFAVLMWLGKQEHDSKYPPSVSLSVAVVSGVVVSYRQEFSERFDVRDAFEARCITSPSTLPQDIELLASEFKFSGSTSLSSWLVPALGAEPQRSLGPRGDPAPVALAGL